MDVTVSAKPIEWRHRELDSGAQWWDDGNYGFHIEIDTDEEEDHKYNATWGEDGENFPTLEEAKSWCQEEVDRLIRNWAVVTPNA